MKKKKIVVKTSISIKFLTMLIVSVLTVGFVVLFFFNQGFQIICIGPDKKQYAGSGFYLWNYSG